MSIQKQKDYYYARFHFSFAPTEKGVAGAAQKLLQRCNHSIPKTPFPLSSIRLFLIPQLYEWLQTQTLTMASAELIEANEQWGNKHPYYFIKFDQTEKVVATLQLYMPSKVASMQFHYHSEQFDEYYSFAQAYPRTQRNWMFWNRQMALEEICHRLRERNYEAIDYSTQLIPE